MFAGLKVEAAPAPAAPARKKQSLITWLRTTSDAGETKPVEMLAKQSDMIEQLQQVLYEERWQHEQSIRILEASVESQQKVLSQYEEEHVR